MNTEPAAVPAPTQKMEAFTFGEGVLPVLARRGLRTPGGAREEIVSVPFAGPADTASADTQPREPAFVGG